MAEAELWMCCCFSASSLTTASTRLERAVSGSSFVNPQIKHSTRLFGCILLVAEVQYQNTKTAQCYPQLKASGAEEQGCVSPSLSASSGRCIGFRGLIMSLFSSTCCWSSHSEPLCSSVLRHCDQIPFLTATNFSQQAQTPCWTAGNSQQHAWVRARVCVVVSRISQSFQNELMCRGRADIFPFSLLTSHLVWQEKTC